LTALLIQVLTIFKDNFERVIFWFILAIFLFLSVKLGTQWGNKGVGISIADEFRLEREYNPSFLNKDIPREETLGASAGLFTKKPVLYYRDFYKRNAFSSVPGLKFKKVPVSNSGSKLPPPPPAVEYEYIGVIDIGGLVATVRNKSTGGEFYVKKGQIVEKHKVLDITKTYVLLSDEDKKKDIKIEIKK